MLAKVYRFPVERARPPAPAGQPADLPVTSAVERRWRLLVRFVGSIQGGPDNAVLLAVAWAWRELAREYVNRHPEVGMSVTYCRVSDCLAFEITRVHPSGKSFLARPLRAVRVDGGRYRYERTNEREVRFTWRAGRGQWRVAGWRTGDIGGAVHLGERNAFYGV